jgi:hypothetical protein
MKEKFEGKRLLQELRMCRGFYKTAKGKRSFGIFLPLLPLLCKKFKYQTFSEMWQNKQCCFEGWYIK